MIAKHLDQRLYSIPATFRDMCFDPVTREIPRDGRGVASQRRKALVLVTSRLAALFAGGRRHLQRDVQE